MIGEWSVVLAPFTPLSFSLSTFLSFCGTTHRSGMRKGTFRGDGKDRQIRLMRCGYDHST